MLSKEDKNLIEEYKFRKEDYRDFSVVIENLLLHLLRKNNIKYLFVSSREKDLNKLEEKIIRKRKECKEYKKFDDIEDLAGVRIVFYLESDLRKFINILNDEFKDGISDYVSKYKEKGYRATHIILKLDGSRLSLSEYEKFEDVKCEVQLTSGLYHVWSELEHDIIYKPLESFDDKYSVGFKKIKEQFETVMEECIKKATYEFESISKEAKKLSEANKLLNVDVQKKILNLKTNDEIIDKLKKIEDFAHLKSKEILHLSKELLSKKPIKPKLLHKFDDHDLYGKNKYDLQKEIIEILGRLRYLETKEVFNILIGLSNSENGEVKSKAQDGLKHLAQFNLFALQKIGYHAQIIILEEIEKWPVDKLLKNLDIMSEIYRGILSSTFEGHSMKDYKTFVFHSGPLKASVKLSEIRKRTISLLQKIYNNTSKIEKNELILQILNIATHTPHSHKYEKDLEEIVIEDTRSIIKFYISLIKKASFRIVKIIEEQIHWINKRYEKEIPDIKKAKNIINANKEYEIFRVLVGFDRMFSDDYNWKEAEKFRKERIKEYITDFNGKNYNKWEKRIVLIIKNYSTKEPGEFRHFNILLNELGKQKPEIAFKLLTRKEKVLEPFLADLVAGIWKSKSKKQAQDLISNWVSKGKHLSLCAFIFDYAEDVDNKILESIFKKAKKLKDIDALTNIVNSVIRNYPKHKSLKKMFIKTIEELTKNKSWWWVNRFWYRGESIMDSLSSKEFNVILNNLLRVPSIDYHIEEILKPLIIKEPKRVISFFQKRVEIKSHKKDDLESDYDAIPYKFYKIQENLKEQAGVIIPELLKWYKLGEEKHNWLYKWEASEMLENIFPSLNPIFEKELIKIIDSGTKDSLDIVFSVLSKYKGGEFLFKIVKKTIIKYAKSKKYNEIESHLFGYLSQTGIVSGEDGFVKAYQGKKNSIQKYKKDKSRYFKNFIDNYDAYLDRLIESEKKRSEENLELRKRGIT